MRLYLPLALLFGALSACEPPLPDGAYAPENNNPVGGGMVGGQPTDAGSGRDEDSAAVIPSMIGGGTPGSSGGVVGMGGDAGIVGPMGGTAGGGDAGPALSEQAMRLQRLVGRYLMRMDMLSTATLRQAVGTVKTSNRVSHLSVTEIYREGETLFGLERLCHQTYQHRCLDNSCASVTTTMSPRVVDKLIGVEPVRRDYTFNGSDFTTSMPEQFIGFDAKTNQSLPTSATDSRVWDTVSGGGREGLLLSLYAKASIITVTCDTYNVQSFGAKFGGAARDGSGQSSLLNTSYTLTSNTEATTLASNNTKDCAPGGDSATAVAGKETVRFAALGAEEFVGDAFWRCPEISAWDKKLPPPAP